MRTVGLPLAGTLAVVAAWWAATAVFGIQSFLLPSPPEVAGAFARLSSYLARHTWTTLVEVIIGYGIATVAGTTLGVGLAFWSVLSRALWPTLVGLHAVPKLALAPMLVVWFGFGATPKIVMVVLVCAFPMVLATHLGVSRTPVELLELARSLTASRWQTVVKIRLPQALPHIFAGLKQAAPLAVIGATVGELFGAVAGLGFLVRGSGSDTAVAFAALVLLAGLSIGLFYLVVGAEKLLLPWLAETTS